MNSMEKLPDLMEELTGLVELPEEWNGDGEIPLTFPDRAKEIIREISKYAQGTQFYRVNQDRREQWTESVKDKTAAGIYWEIIIKAASAPTRFHAEFTAIGLMPELSRKLGLEE